MEEPSMSSGRRSSLGGVDWIGKIPPSTQSPLGPLGQASHMARPLFAPRPGACELAHLLSTLVSEEEGARVSSPSLCPSPLPCFLNTGPDISSVILFGACIEGVVLRDK